jgi:hypothetical protein
MPAETEIYFRHLKPAEKATSAPMDGRLFMPVARPGSKLWRFGHRDDG